MKEELIPANGSRQLFLDIQQLIEEARISVRRAVNSRLVALYWHVGKRINDEVLQNERAPYGEQLVENLSGALVVQFGRNFALRNLRRMMQMATFFPDPEIVSTLSTQLSWSHFVELLSIEARERLARKKLLP